MPSGLKNELSSLCKGEVNGASATTRPAHGDNGIVLMHKAKTLPIDLIERYRDWYATHFEANRALYETLADDGQHPRALVISCCDSRVNITSIFGADAGEFFIHRNIAALVPPHGLDQETRGTAAAIQYAVQHLNVASILVVGHAGCGGVAACHDMAGSDTDEVDPSLSFIDTWLNILKPGLARISGEDRPDRLEEFEQIAVRIGLENLMSYPFVAEAVRAGTLDLHGLWADMRAGEVHVLDAATDQFTPIPST